MQFDVFNGDADGLCSLLQLRLANPLKSTLITGVKREINLLERVVAEPNDKVVVLDISMKKNTVALNALLQKGVEVFYCDHHQAGDIPQSPRLTSLVNADANICTSLLMNGYLQGQFPEWAIAGAFGDNLKISAQAVAKPLNLSEDTLATIERVGILLNYNGYGATLDDLYFQPDALFRTLNHFTSPLSFYHECKTVFDQLDAGYEEDLNAATQATYLFSQTHAAVLCLPNEAWARRVSGVYSNDLANNHPDRAHAVLTEKKYGGFLVSIRAPLNNKKGADIICSQFPTGGGRAAAAGINTLAQSDLDKFIQTFQQFYSS